MEEEQQESQKNILSFAKTTTKYFQDFLETDFHRRSKPKRRVKLRSKDNLQLGFKLNKYPEFRKEVYEKTIKDGFNNSIEIKKGEYQKNIPNRILNLIELETEKIDKKRVDNLVDDFVEVIEKSAQEYEENIEKAIEVANEKIKKLIKEQIVEFLILKIEEPLEKIRAEREADFVIKSRLQDIIFNKVKEEVETIITKLIGEKEVDIEHDLEEVLTAGYVQEEIKEFFNDLKINDLFTEIYELKNNQEIEDKKEFYFYYFSLNFDNTTYPIFYTSFSLGFIEEQKELKIDFGEKIYINKKALEFITQEFNEINDRKGKLENIQDRINYISEHEDNLEHFLEEVINEIVNYFNLDNEINLQNEEKQKTKNEQITLSNSCYFVLFDKADEAIINDYEELLKFLKTEGDLGKKFKNLIEDFIESDPDRVVEDIERNWREKETEEKLVTQSPIPLNAEQRQIMKAVNRKDCNYISVEGPPGTGKSHTITAVIFDAILKDKSALVLSDKKEALDVVENKITNTLDKLRVGEKFQNPILRLGKTGKNLHKILSKNSIDKIRKNYKAIEKDKEELDQNLSNSTSTLKQKIHEQAENCEDIEMEDILEFNMLKQKLGEISDIITGELTKSENTLIKLNDLRDTFNKVNNLNKEEYKILKFLGYESFKSINDLKSLVDELSKLKEGLDKTKEVYSEITEIIDEMGEIDEEKLKKLEELVKVFVDLPNPIIGYLFQKNKKQNLIKDFKKTFPYSSLSLEKDLEQLKKIIKSLDYFEQQLGSEYDIKSLSYLLSRNGREELNKLLNIKKDLSFAHELSKDFESFFEKIGFDSEKLETYKTNKLIKVSESEFDQLLYFLKLKIKLDESFENLEEVNYLEQRNKIEELATLKMSYMMDKRLIDFYEENSATAKTLAKKIKNKKRLNPDDFRDLKEAFPCILAGIRDYSEYIPLDSDLFDLIIIDEASQVSIAQAFPALLRAKTVLILGDRLQFGNVKAAHAKKEINNQYQQRIKESFKDNVSKDDNALERLKHIDIKESILDLFEYINNFEIQLKKHFRGYKEIISFSDSYFYDDSLEVMKVRAKSIDEVIKFSHVEHDGKVELKKNTNLPEIQHIISKMREMKENGNDMSLGIITPFRNQQKLAQKKIKDLPDANYYFEEMDLKIMTFDSCQGEERDVVFYSMVANEVEDKLWAIFPKTIRGGQKDIKNNLRLQRLNVGLSRAKECMHFVVSKPVRSLSSAAREALLHYQNVKEEAHEEKSSSEVDEKSEMEPKVLSWFYQTEFWEQNKENIVFKPQFELGKYLKQLDSNYDHPEYKVDFLLVYTDDERTEHKIIIEYDGLREHFNNLDNINQFNYEEYYTEEDLYRQKVLEGYGYNFLRINKFNVGENPVQRLDKRINNLIEKNKTNDKVEKIKERVEGLGDGSYKICNKCDEVKKKSKFKDQNLKTNYGRHCRECKNISEDSISEESQDVKCPKCGSNMVIRNGKYGKFYGCSRFPRCKGTRQVG